MASEIDLPSALLGASITPCGSRVTCDPAPTDTDADYLIDMSNIRATMEDAAEGLLAAGYVREGSKHYDIEGSVFASFRRGHVNLLVTKSFDFARRHRCATKLCTRLNLLNKQDRIAVFDAVLYTQ